MISSASYAGETNTIVLTQPDNKLLPIWHKSVVEFKNNGGTIDTYFKPAKTQQEIIDEIEQAVQNHLDSKAQSLGYDSIYTACTYADEPAVAKFQQEGQALRAWRSLVWNKCYELLQLGQVMTEQQVIDSLPSYE